VANPYARARPRILSFAHPVSARPRLRADSDLVGLRGSYRQL